MDILEMLFFGIVDAIKALYGIPVQMIIDPYDNFERIFGLFFFVILYGITAFLAFLFLRWLYGRAQWYRNRQHCQHQECNQQWTLGVQTGNQLGCRTGQPCCSYCDNRHADDNARRDADAEKYMQCPHGHGDMRKDIDNRIIIDVCPTCSFTGLEADELQALLNRAEQRGYDRGYSEGKSNGQTTGFIVGSALN